MLCFSVEYQGFTQLNARIDARNASVYAVSRAFLVRFHLVFAMRAKLLYMCIAKSAIMVEMHYFPLTYTISLFPLSRYLHTYLVCILSVFTLDS